MVKLTIDVLDSKLPEKNVGLQNFLDKLYEQSSEEDSFGATLKPKFDVLRDVKDDVLRDVKDLKECNDCHSKVFPIKLMRDEEGNLVQNKFVSSTGEPHGMISVSVEPSMVGKTYMAYVYFAEGEKPKLCAIPLLQQGVVEEEEEGTILMVVPFQVVDLKTAEPVKVDAPVGNVRCMFTTELRKVQDKDILISHNPDGSIDSDSIIRLAERMQEDRELCLERHNELVWFGLMFRAANEEAMKFYDMKATMNKVFYDTKATMDKVLNRTE